MATVIMRSLGLWFASETCLAHGCTGVRTVQMP
jgi:hypothetical protein